MNPSNMTPEERAAFWERFDRNAQVVARGIVYQLTEEEILPSTYVEDPTSTWYKASLVGRVRNRLEAGMDRGTAMQLIAMTMRTTVEDLESALEWNANYLAWHDGGSPTDNHAWP